MTTTTSLLSDAQLLSRLVGFDSTSYKSNRPIAEFVCEYLDRPGIRIERQNYPEDDKLNLVITVGPQVNPQSRAGLVLSGHLDVVPAVEPDWQSDPFELTETEAGFVGRGACDMKGFVALAINALARSSGQQLGKPLSLILTCDEELGTLGARHFVDHWPTDSPLPRHAIIGEPTSLNVVRMHKGHCKMRLAVDGKSAHSGYPHLGENAIERLAPALVALAELRSVLETELGPNAEHFPEVPFIALNLARVRGGTAINIIPNRAELDLGFRVLPGMTAKGVAERVRRTLAEVFGEVPFELEEINQSPPMLLPESDELYRHLCRVMGQETTVSASYATDAGWLQEGGFKCLLWGPGTIEVAHRPNEWIPKDEFYRASKLLQQVVDECCGGGN